MKYILLIVPLFAISCKTINKDALAAWMSKDAIMMQDLEDYRKAQGKLVDDVVAHAAKAFGDITNDEETALMAEILADVQNDPKKIDKRKTSYDRDVTAHLRLFHSLKGN